MKKISFIITNFNTKKYTEWCYNSIRKNLGYIHEIILLDDGSTDKTWELLEEISNKDINVVIHKNDKNTGIAYSYNKAVELASNEIVCMLHSDMYIPPKFDEIMLNYMEDYDFLTALRVEPEVYPGGVDKIIKEFGRTVTEFKENDFIEWHENNIVENSGRVEQRMFFPWMTTKTLYDKVGGLDLLFLKYMVDDDDFYLRIKMSGAKYTQVWETAVYHMPSKSTKFKETKKKGAHNRWEEQYNKSVRNFVRKWGVYPGTVWDDNRDMIIHKKYDIGLVIDNCDEKTLKFLEPWCSTIYIYNRRAILDYCMSEQPNTLYDLSERVKHISIEPDNDIIVKFDAQ